MVNHCVVGGCNNREGRDKSSRRDFLVFHKCPNDPARRSAWDKRINRGDQDVKKLTLAGSVYRVCSDHFNDCDYREEEWNKYLETGQAKGMKLNGTCLPNTDPTTGALNLYTPGQSSTKKPRRTLVRSSLMVSDEQDVMTDFVNNPYESSNIEETDRDQDDYRSYLVDCMPQRDAQTQTSDFAIQAPEEAFVDDSFSEADFSEEYPDDADDYLDPDYVQPHQSNLSSFSEEGPRKRRDYRKRLTEFMWIILSVDSLISLFKRCPECGSVANALPASYVIGYTTYIYYKCFGVVEHIGLWVSSPKSGRLCQLNVLMNTASSLCGLGHTALTNLFETLQMPAMTNTSYHDHEVTWLFPEVYSMFLKTRDETMAAAKQKADLVLTGDGQFDSPGYSAKYCVYTVMLQGTGKILDFFISQKGLFTDLERAACRELLLKLKSKGLDRFSLVTDRHSGIKSMIRDMPDFKNITHFFDIWHLAKNISKKLGKLTKLKRNAPLLPWVRKILNHFWYSCRNCGGDKRKLIETWLSFLLHISNSHRWSTGTFSKLRGDQPYPSFTKVFSCAHGKRIKKGALRKGNWLKRSSRTFKDLFSKLTKKQLVEDIQHCSSFHHTESLENYHNVRLKYLPKRISYTRASTAIKSMVAIIEVNENAAIAPGERKMYAVYSKAKAGWVLKKTHVKKDYGYRKNIMANILNRIVIQKPLSIDMTEYIPDNLPKNIAPVPKPSIDELMKKHRSRMAMS